MKIKDFIATKMEAIVASFSDIQCRYYFDQSSLSHFIEILPLTEFKNNEDLQDLLADLYDEFDERYPKDVIGFVSEDRLSKLGTSIMTVSGAKYSGIEISESISWFKLFMKSTASVPANKIVEAGENNYALAA